MIDRLPLAEKHMLKRQGMKKFLLLEGHPSIWRSPKKFLVLAMLLANKSLLKNCEKHLVHKGKDHVEVEWKV